MIKIVAHYAPHYFNIIEHGREKCHSAWTFVTGARPLFKGHHQPRRPLSGRFSRLDGGEVLRWQVRLALEHGIYGFCFWHDWSQGRPLFEKPAALLLADRSLKIRFCFNWTLGPNAKAGPDADLTSPMGRSSGGGQDWKTHFTSLAPYLEDPRYIKIDKKPVLLIEDSSRFPDAAPLLESWNAFAVERGFPGIYFIQMLSSHPLDPRPLPFNARVYCEPGFTIGHTRHPPWRTRENLMPAVPGGVNRSPHPLREGVHIISYDDIYQVLLQRPPGKGVRDIPGVFTDWNDSPRHGRHATVCSGGTPAKFEAYLLRQIERSFSLFNSDMIFVNAWNAWADGAYLEPDERYGNGYLNAVKGAKERCLSLDLPLFYRTLF